MSSTTAGVAVAVSASTRCGAELARALRELEVVGPEVVAPFGDAVRLVDGEERDLQAPASWARKRSLLKRSGAT